VKFLCIVKQAEARLQQEVARVAAYLHSSTEEKLLKDIEEQLLANHQMALLDKEETGYCVKNICTCFVLAYVI
jgi:hypothetical protein